MSGRVGGCVASWLWGPSVWVGPVLCTAGHSRQLDRRPGRTAGPLEGHTTGGPHWRALLQLQGPPLPVVRAGPGGRVGGATSTSRIV